MKATFVVGLQYGDEGKGKIVDLLAEKHDVIVRGNGGSNAGHTIVLKGGKTLALHQIPSGITYGGKQNIIGNGCFFDPVKLAEEIKNVTENGVNVSPKNLAISKAAHIVLPVHKAKDALREGGVGAQGSTKAGIAFVASDKYLREGIRAEAALNKSEKELYKIAHDGLVELGEAKPQAAVQATEFALETLKLSEYIVDTVELIHQQINSGKEILVEGAQAFGLDINHGKYPFTTSSDTTVAGLLSGTGLNYKQIGKVIGVAKAIPSKVGGGNFVTAIGDKKIAEQTRGEKGRVDSEFGATTGRPRGVGYLDLVALKRAVEVNGVDEIALTKLDCLIRHGKTTKIAVAYKLDGQEIESPPTSNEELAKCQPVYRAFSTWKENDSAEAEEYLEFIEKYLKIPITMIGTGPGRNDLFIRTRT
ncbi:adenylosuccinate synthetase [Candidatus Parcubacteria bacterium]|nr:adenylosuccinate synthetase [Candidatus Parcubacteria bacterium]